MSITYPTFSDKEIVSPEKLNNFVDAIEAKFTAGIATTEIQWPLIAGGNLSMGTYDILKGRRIMKIVNADAYDTLGDALTAAGTSGSGYVVYIPPNTTLQADGEEIVGTQAAIIGAGPTSVLQCSDSPTAAYFLRNASTGVGTRFLIANLTIDGNDKGASVDGLEMRRVENACIHNVIFKNWSGVALKITSEGGDANASQNVQITDNEFYGGTEQHLLVDSAVQLTLKGNTSELCDTVAFDFTPASASALLQRINIIGNRVSSCDEEMIRVQGNGGTVSSNWANIVITDNNLDGAGQDATKAGIVAGASAAVLRDVNVSDNVITNAGWDAIVSSFEFGVIADNVAPSAGGDGLDLLDSEDVVVNGNVFTSATSFGIDASGSVDCNIVCNNVSSCSSTNINSTTLTGSQHGNQGFVGKPPNVFLNKTVSNATGGTATAVCTVTIPANFLQIGDVLSCHGVGIAAGTADVGSLKIRIATNNVASAGLHTALSAHVMAKVIITHATTIQYLGLGSDETTAIDVGAGTYGSIDLTTAIDLDLYADPGATNTISGRGLIVEVSKAEVQ